jgi:hypothetical protein
MSFRSSRFIDFNTGLVLKPPMDLLREQPTTRSLVDNLELFECRVEVWQLAPAVEVLKRIEGTHDQTSAWAHAAYALLSIGFSYFEMIGKTLNPSSQARGSAGPDFNFGFCDVYPAFAIAGADRSDASLPTVKAIKDRVRNGLYHLGYTKRHLFIHNDPARSLDDFSVDRSAAVPTYFVNPHQMIRTILNHFPSLVGRLRDPKSANDVLRMSFQRFFTSFHE